MIFDWESEECSKIFSCPCYFELLVKKDCLHSLSIFTASFLLLLYLARSAGLPVDFAAWNKISLFLMALRTSLVINGEFPLILATVWGYRFPSHKKKCFQADQYCTCWHHLINIIPLDGIQYFSGTVPVCHWVTLDSSGDRSEFAKGGPEWLCMI